MKTLKTKRVAVKVGDRVWLRIPHNGKVEKIYKDGSVRVELDEIPSGTIMERFDSQNPEEMEVIPRSKREK